MHYSRIQLYNLDTADLIKTVLPNINNMTISYFNLSYFIKEL